MTFSKRSLIKHIGTGNFGIVFIFKRNDKFPFHGYLWFCLGNAYELDISLGLHLYSNLSIIWFQMRPNATKNLSSWVGPQFCGPQSSGVNNSCAT